MSIARIIYCNSWPINFHLTAIPRVRLMNTIGIHHFYYRLSIVVQNISGWSKWCNNTYDLGIEPAMPRALHIYKWNSERNSHCNLYKICITMLLQSIQYLPHKYLSKYLQCYYDITVLYPSNNSTKTIRTSLLDRDLKNINKHRQSHSLQSGF